MRSKYMRPIGAAVVCPRRIAGVYIRTRGDRDVDQGRGEWFSSIWPRNLECHGIHIATALKHQIIAQFLMLGSYGMLAELNTFMPLRHFSARFDGPLCFGLMCVPCSGATTPQCGKNRDAGKRSHHRRSSPNS
jgi:hypothetical protein